MTLKHYFAIALPYLLAAVAGAAALMAKSPDARVALVGATIAGLVAVGHANVYLAPPAKADQETTKP